MYGLTPGATSMAGMERQRKSRMARRVVQSIVATLGEIDADLEAEPLTGQHFALLQRIIDAGGEAQGKKMLGWDDRIAADLVRAGCLEELVLKPGCFRVTRAGYVKAANR